MQPIPEEIVELAQQRASAKAERDFARADVLRDEIANAGWQIVDVPGGFELVPKPPFEVAASVDQATFEPIAASVSVGLIVDGWWGDARTCLDSLLRYTDAAIYVMDVSGDAELAHSLSEFAREHHDRMRATHVADAGWGPAARRLINLSTSPLHVLMDPSTVLLGEAFSLMGSAFSDESVVAVGWQGALVDREDNWRSVRAHGPGEVDVLLGYLMMVRREALLATQYPHPKARFYRNADLELSLGLRAAGGRLLAMELPVEQGRHHGYHDSDPEFRDRESKRNYDRILATFRGREEILTPDP